MNIAVYVICGILIGAAPIAAIALFVIGKVKLSRALRPIEYYPPRGFSPIDVLIKYYSKFADPHKLFNPLILYWADKGFITIEEDCKRGLKLTKLRPLTPPAENAEYNSVKKYYRNKIKATEAEREQTRYAKRNKKTEYTWKGSPECEQNFELEKKLFDEIFLTSDVFYTLAADDFYKSKLDDFMTECRSAARRQNSKASLKADIAVSVSAMLALIVSTVICGATLRDPILLTMIFPIVGVVAIRLIPSKEMLYFKYPFFAVWGGAPLGAMIASAPHDCAILLGVAVASAFLCVNVIAPNIDLRSAKDLDIYGRIDAFKTFLLDAEKDRLELLVADDPDYFYDILPHCYILNITKKLKPKFDRISMDGPSWYLGDLRDTLMF